VCDAEVVTDLVCEDMGSITLRPYFIPGSRVYSHHVDTDTIHLVASHTGKGQPLNTTTEVETGQNLHNVGVTTSE
jgi:hypothetical protein